MRPSVARFARIHRVSLLVVACAATFLPCGCDRESPADQPTRSSIGVDTTIHSPANTLSDDSPAAPSVEVLSSQSPPAQSHEGGATTTSVGSPTFERPAILDEADISVDELYKAYCGACHSLELVELQRLDRSNWEWVMDDMIDQYGAAWITDSQRKLIVDYLIEHFGPDVPR